MNIDAQIDARALDKDDRMLIHDSLYALADARNTVWNETEDVQQTVNDYLGDDTAKVNAADRAIDALWENRTGEGLLLLPFRFQPIAVLIGYMRNRLQGVLPPPTITFVEPEAEKPAPAAAIPSSSRSAITGCAG